MIVKILSSSSSFRGVEYNTNKVDNGKGELMQVLNFGPLQGFTNLRPEDYKNYLKLVSSQNKNIEKPQFHVAISCLGKEFDKHQLTKIGEGWLKEMGYGDNPFLIVFHKDTDNNHVHLVSTRIDKKGKKINSDFEKIRAYVALNKVMGLDVSLKVNEDIKKNLSFNFSTKPQFKLLMEKNGYAVTENEKGIDIIKFGKVLITIPAKDIEDKIISSTPEVKRVSQIRAFIEKYKVDYSGSVYPTFTTFPSGEQKHTGYTSDLAEHLKATFGLEMVFHYKDNKPPYGVTVIDFKNKNVFKGSQIIKLKELLENRVDPGKKIEKDPYATHLKNRVTDQDELAYYKTLVQSTLISYPTLQEGLKHQGFDLVIKNEEHYIIDINSDQSIKLDDLIERDTSEYSRFSDISQKESSPDGSVLDSLHGISFSGGDIDDEQINGRNRRKKGMARTNTR